MKVTELQQKFREQVDKHIDSMMSRGQSFVSVKALEDEMRKSEQGSESDGSFKYKVESHGFGSRNTQKITSQDWSRSSGQDTANKINGTKRAGSLIGKGVRHVGSPQGQNQRIPAINAREY